MPSPTRREFLTGAAQAAGVTTLGSFARAGEVLVLTFSADELAKAFVARHEAEVRPLEKASSLAWWVANVSGKDADFAAKEQAQNRLDAAPRRPRPLRPAQEYQGTLGHRPAARTADRRALPDVPGKAGRSRTPEEDHREGQRHRADVQRLSRQGGRQGTDRQRGPQDPQGVQKLGRRRAVWEASKGVGQSWRPT